MRRIVLALTVLAFSQTACFGSFAATRTLYNFNKGISSDKWLQELLFLGLTILPAYSLFALGDVLIFNSIEFWGGSNPIKADASEPRTRDVMLADGSTARLVEEESGMRIEHGDQVFRVVRSEGGLDVLDRDGNVLSSLREGENGAVVVTDAAGERQVIGADEMAAAGNSAESITAWTLARAGR